MMRVLVTRPAQDGRDFAIKLATMGLEPVCIPLLEIEHSDKPPPFTPDTLVITSKQAAVWASQFIDKGTWCIAVGEESGNALTEVGFTHVQAAGGDVKALIKFIKTQKPTGRMLYARGTDVSYEMARALSIDEHIAYTATPQLLSAPRVMDFLAGDPAIVTLFSARTAKIFSDIVLGSDVPDATSAHHLLCFADSVLQSVRFLPWYKTITCAQPRMACMYQEIELLLRHKA
jgi:uroporphyrinogen-III synthase